MFFIAMRFGVSLEALIAANPQISDPNTIFPGQLLCIPSVVPTTTPTPTITPTSNPCPTLRRGDTGPSVVKLQTLLLAAGFNPGPIDGIFGPLTESAVIAFQTAEGLVVDGIVGVQTWTALGVQCFPTTTPPPSECINGFIYTVKPGDTLSTIANTFGICLEAIIATNPQITNPDLIFPGQQICIPGPASCSGFIYTVVQGDTLSAIAARFGVTVNQILIVNPQICNPDVIFVGEKICIPTTAPTTIPPTTIPPSACINGFIYTVQPGDTLSGIANTFGICLEAIIIANPGINPNLIFPGQKICIPGPSTCSGFIYTVVQGDTLSTIAARFGVTVNQILAVNPQICNKDVIFVGEKICIPTTPPTTIPPTTIPPTTIPPTTIPPTFPPPPSCVNGFIYTVKPGDTLSGIANTFGICLDAIIDANPQITNPSLIFPGQKICLPGPSTCSGFIYTIQPGDTLFSLAIRFGVTVNQIMTANPQICNEDIVFVGEKICIPTTPPTTIPPTTIPPTTIPPTTQPPLACVNGFIYTVKAGDSLSAIANSFGICLEAIIAANPQITNPDLIFPGQKICIPGPSTCSGFIYTVQQGDTLSAIAARFGVTVNQILAANPQVCNKDVIFVGEKICIPTNISTSSPIDASSKKVKNLNTTYQPKINIKYD
ncbi:MAG TPA: LysM peptidoglycan-binding domain-containing protein [Clostridia bacterium]|nr:LysM peptidoglycan-binding domain-containing protein [Clostridia bacterium]